MYFEDLEFSRRVATKFQMGYTSAAVAYHKCGAGKGWQTYAELYLYYQTRNRFWVFRKDPLWYRVYVFVFTMTIACAKAIVIFPNLLKGREQGMRQQRALWKGLWDCLRSQFSEEPVGSLQGENHLR